MKRLIRNGILLSLLLMGAYAPAQSQDCAGAFGMLNDPATLGENILIVGKQKARLADIDDCLMRGIDAPLPIRPSKGTAAAISARELIISSHACAPMETCNYAGRVNYIQRLKDRIKMCVELICKADYDGMLCATADQICARRAEWLTPLDFYATPPAP